MEHYQRQQHAPLHWSESSHDDRLISSSGVYIMHCNCQDLPVVQQLIFQRVIGQVVELLKHQDLDHQHRRIRRTATLGARRPRRAASMPAASASKSTCLVKQTIGSPIFVRRSSRSCSANRPIRGFIIAATRSMEVAKILPAQASRWWVFRGRLNQRNATILVHRGNYMLR